MHHRVRGTRRAQGLRVAHTKDPTRVCFSSFRISDVSVSRSEVAFSDKRHAMQADAVGWHAVVCYLLPYATLRCTVGPASRGRAALVVFLTLIGSVARPFIRYNRFCLYGRTHARIRVSVASCFASRPVNPIRSGHKALRGAEVIRKRRVGPTKANGTPAAAAFFAAV